MTAQGLKVLGLMSGAVLICITAALVLRSTEARKSGPGLATTTDSFPADSRMLERASTSENLIGAPGGSTAPPLLPGQRQTRTGFSVERARMQALNDYSGLAQVNAVLATEAFKRVARLTSRWLDHRDASTGLFPHTLRPSGRYWSYGDVGADLFPFLAIATHELLPSRYGEILDTLEAERGLRPGFPRDVMIDTLHPRDDDYDKQVLRNVEYAKDGLLPLVERLGPDPWLRRLREVVDAVLDGADVSTPRGPVVSAEAEVNGSLLQVLARLTWAHGELDDLTMGRRIAALYLDDVLPSTGWIPPERWDFAAARPLGDAGLHLGDHGDEIVSGLIEWHAVEVEHGLPKRTTHGQALNRMLDRLLTTGRTSQGLWLDGIAYPSGRVVDRTLNDNWGYLGQAYVNRAAMLRGGDGAADGIADRYERSAWDALRAVTDVRYYRWEHGDMDGYADTLESALYLVRYLDVPRAPQWIDEQMGVLYGFQKSDGMVTDENIDGNFIRTGLLYGFWLTQGAWVAPWSPDISFGSAEHDGCLQVSLHSESAWTGGLRFDSSRHTQYLGLPWDYPRLNQWPEWWVPREAEAYTVSGSDGSSRQVSGAELIAGLPVTIPSGEAVALDICPASM